MKKISLKAEFEGKWDATKKKNLFLGILMAFLGLLFVMNLALKMYVNAMIFAFMILAFGWAFDLGIWAKDFKSIWNKKSEAKCKYHFWRPAIKEVIVNEQRQNKAAKYCDRCMETVILTQEEFYSQFGYMPWGGTIKF